MQYNSIFKYRSIWMGIAIIWVFFYHMLSFLGVPVLSDIIEMGYAGCDIFLFASGIGIYYSLDKNDNLFSYFKKRILRLMPLYWLILIIWIPFRFSIGQMTWQATIGSIFGIQYFIDWNFDYNWYIPVVLLCYIVAPILKQIIDRISAASVKIFLILVLICISFAFSSDAMMMIGMTRIPIFVIGMMFGQLGRQEKSLSTGSKTLWLILIPIGYIVAYLSQAYLGWMGWKSGLNWLPLMLSTPGLCVLISMCASKLESGNFSKAVNRFFTVIGGHSLEIYFAHVTVVLVFRDYMIKEDVSLNTPINWGIAIAISIVGAFALVGVQKLINKGLSMKKG